MLDSISAHVEFIHGNDIFGKVVTNIIICAEFPLYGSFGSKQIKKQEVGRKAEAGLCKLWIINYEAR